MLILAESELMRRALRRGVPAANRRLVSKYLRHTIDAGLEAITQILVVAPTDPIAGLNDELGLSLFWDLDGHRWTSPDFAPRHDWLGTEDGWFVVIVCAGDTGYASIVLIDGARDDELGEFCRHFTSP